MLVITVDDSNKFGKRELKGIIFYKTQVTPLSSQTLGLVAPFAMDHTNTDQR